MSPEEFTQFIETVIREEVSFSQPCGCCGIGGFEGVDSAAERILAAIPQFTPVLTGEEKCGRCAKPTPVAEITRTGPYRTCPPCTVIIRN